MCICVMFGTSKYIYLYSLQKQVSFRYIRFRYTSEFGVNTFSLARIAWQSIAQWFCSFNFKKKSSIIYLYQIIYICICRAYIK